MASELVRSRGDHKQELLVVEKLAQALEQAVRVDEIKDVRDRAMAIQLYARKKAGGLAAAQAAGRIVTKATLMLARLYSEEKSAQEDGLKRGSRLNRNSDGELPGKIAIAQAADMHQPALAALGPLAGKSMEVIDAAVAAIEARGEIVSPTALSREVEGASGKSPGKRTAPKETVVIINGTFLKAAELAVLKDAVVAYLPANKTKSLQSVAKLLRVAS